MAFEATAFSPAKRRARRRQQRAYVAYVQAYGMAYPREAHLLPDAWKGQRMPEFAAFNAARALAEGAR
jgi:hypothetical protein